MKSNWIKVGGGSGADESESTLHVIIGGNTFPYSGAEGISYSGTAITPAGLPTTLPGVPSPSAGGIVEVPVAIYTGFPYGFGVGRLIATKEKRFLINDLTLGSGNRDYTKGDYCVVSGPLIWDVSVGSGYYRWTVYRIGSYTEEP